ncbi:Dehydrogenase/reductase SDR family member 13 [Trichostrongylus colubriformis]|uniref:Dehydrogenase/reductase SDR family member 13 n=1 Tax=Trichostrongylus colubriformis TaxID=6319 RepID=A0AAN8IDJ5_TRICO
MYGGHKGLHPWHHWSLFGHVYCDPTKTASSFLRGLANGRSYQKKRDYYEVLGVKRNATQEEIKAAFYAKSKKLHPDKGTNGNGSNSTADFVDLKEAYDVLRRPADRRAYDLRGFEYERLKHQDPYYYYKRRQQQQQRADSGFWGTSGNMRDSEFKRQSEDQWRFIWKLTAIGVAFVVVYNVVYVLQLRTRERKIAQLVDEDEIAKSFMRQPEFRNTTIDDLEVINIFQLLMYCNRSRDMEGKIVLITGSTSGLGLHTAKNLFLRGATVILTCRDEVRGRAALEAVQAQIESGEEPAGGRLHLFTLDLACYQSTLNFCHEIKQHFDRIDVLINNAGVMGLAFELSRNGIEMHFATNAFGHFVLVNNLLPLLEKSADGRIVIVSSGLYKGVTHIPSIRQLMGEHDWDYQARFAYALSKLANCLHAVELAKRLKANRCSTKVYAIRPGFVGAKFVISSQENAADMWKMFRRMEELILIRCHTLTEDDRRQAEEARKMLPKS